MAPDVLEIDPEGDLIIVIPDLVRTASQVLDKQAGGGGDEPDMDRTPESVAIGLSFFSSYQLSSQHFLSNLCNASASNGSRRRILHFRVSIQTLGAGFCSSKDNVPASLCRVQEG